MHRVCACRSQVAACKVIQTNRTHLTRYIDVQQYTGNILGNLFSYAAVCCYLLAVVLQLPAQGLCSMPTQPGTGCRFALIQLVRMSRSITACYAQTVHCSCLQIILVTAACTGFVQHVVEVNHPARSVRTTDNIQTGTPRPKTYSNILSNLFCICCCQAATACTG
jgi:hypothetical protein